MRDRVGEGTASNQGVDLADVPAMHAAVDLVDSFGLCGFVSTEAHVPRVASTSVRNDGSKTHLLLASRRHYCPLAWI
jgi:hypothetical protein